MREQFKHLLFSEVITFCLIFFFNGAYHHNVAATTLSLLICAVCFIHSWHSHLSHYSLHISLYHPLLLKTLPTRMFILIYPTILFFPNFVSCNNFPVNLFSIISKSILVWDVFSGVLKMSNHRFYTTVCYIIIIFANTYLTSMFMYLFIYKFSPCP